MTVVALTNFLELRENGNIVYRFQNSLVGETIRYRAADWSYLSFMYEGAALNRSGDNLEATLILAANKLSINYGMNAVNKNWSVKLYSCSMSADRFTVARTLATEVWLASSLSYDEEAVQIRLSSAIDAVGALVPYRTLITRDVGRLPVTGQVQNR